MKQNNPNTNVPNPIGKGIGEIEYIATKLSDVPLSIRSQLITDAVGRLRFHYKLNESFKNGGNLVFFDGLTKKVTNNLKETPSKDLVITNLLLLKALFLIKIPPGSSVIKSVTNGSVRYGAFAPDWIDEKKITINPPGKLKGFFKAVVGYDDPLAKLVAVNILLHKIDSECPIPTSMTNMTKEQAEYMARVMRDNDLLEALYAKAVAVAETGLFSNATPNQSRNS